MNTIIDALSLVISIATLGFLIKYVRATETIAKQSIEQVEAVFRPALVAQVGLIDKPPSLVNVGIGTAVDIDWWNPKLESQRDNCTLASWGERSAHGFV
jgi:hypothetical protein